MEFYLVRLSYTAAAWGELIEASPSLDERLDPVRGLIRHLGGSLASFHFDDYPDTGGSDALRVFPPWPPKFVLFGEHDLFAVVVFPDKTAAMAFNMTVSAEPGLKTLDLISVMPFEDAIAALPRAKQALKETNYAAPGRGAR